MLDKKLNDKIITNIYNEYCSYIEQSRTKETQLVDRLNEKFNTNIIEGIFWQPSDGLVILWEDSYSEHNSYFDIREVLALNTTQEFVQYLKNNSI